MFFISSLTMSPLIYLSMCFAHFLLICKGFCVNKLRILHYKLVIWEAAILPLPSSYGSAGVCSISLPKLESLAKPF